MSMFLGGHSIIGMGWLGHHSVFVDFVSTYTSGFFWQLYANQKLIGVTRSTAQRRIVGQMLRSDAPSPLKLVRVTPDDKFTDFGSQLPAGPFNRYLLRWVSPALPANMDHFDVIGPSGPGVSPSRSNVLGQVPYVGAGTYSFALRPIAIPGNWTFGIVPRDNSKPLGNPGTELDVTINVALMPPDVEQDAFGNRFNLSVSGGVLTAAFAY